MRRGRDGAAPDGVETDDGSLASDGAAPVCVAGSPARRCLLALAAPAAVLALLVLWQLVCAVGLVPSYLLPSPVAVVRAFASDWQLMAGHAVTTVVEAAAGLLAGIALGAVAAVLMDRFELVYRAFYPLVVLTQTIPTVAIAPLLVLWFGYGMAPKVVLIVVTTFFPVTVGLLDGFRSVDPDQIDLLCSMGATRSLKNSCASPAARGRPWAAVLEIFMQV